MPRPKNKIIAPSKFATVPPRDPKPVTARRTKQQPEPLSTTSDRVATGSDDSEGLVKTQWNRATRKAVVVPDITMMSGALAPGDANSGRVKPLTGRKRAALSRIARNADHDKAIAALKARRDAALAAEKGIKVHVPSVVPTEPGTAAENGIKVHVPSVVPTEPSMAAEKEPELRDRALDAVPGAVDKNPSIQATPRAALASAFRGSNIKRRPRQPSLLHLVQAQANRQDESEDDDLDDFHPDDESTPLVLSTTHLVTHGSPSPSPASSPNQSSSRKRKLSSPIIQVERSQSVEAHAFSPQIRSKTAELDLEDEDYNLPFTNSNHNEHPEPSLPRPGSPQSSHSIQWSDTYAPPQSSSLSPHELSDPVLPPGQPTHHPVSHSPRVSRPLKPLSTATLQNLLPRRRVRHTPREPDPFDVPSSSEHGMDTSRLSAEADELTVAAKPKVRRKKHVKDPPPKTSSASKKKPHGGGGIGGGKDDASGPGATTYSRKKITKPRKPKTYTRGTQRTANDDNETFNHHDPHNEDTQDHTISHSPPDQPARTTSELQRLARKFQEVDRWELEIEEVTPTSSSQKDAR
jgi:hypothetical protein